MSRLIMPEQNVKYTLAFNPKKKMTYRWYGDYKQKQNGQLTKRLMFYNETTHRYTDMTLSYFRYLCRRHLVEKMPVDCEGFDLNGMPIKKEKPKTPEAQIKKKIEKTQREEDIEIAEFWLRKVQSITPQEKYRLECEFNGDSLYDIDKISNDLKNIIKGKLLDESKTDDVFSMARRLDSIVSRYRANKPLSSSPGRIFI